jgi:hypothetical protein
MRRMKNKGFIKIITQQSSNDQKARGFNYSKLIINNRQIKIEAVFT